MTRRCSQYGWLYLLALALFVIVAAFSPLRNCVAELVVGAGVVAAMFVWCKRCRPEFCRVLAATLIGLVLGAAVLALFLLAGLTAARGQLVLALTAVAIGLVVIIGVWRRCFRL